MEIHSFFSLETLLLILLASCIPWPTLASPNNFTDLSALLAFQSQVYDPNGFMARSWNTNTSFCSWAGVSCSRQRQRVTSLVLKDLSLQGIIPPQLANLSFLEHLHLGNNSFSGPIPDGLGYLRRLKFLVLQQNQLSGSIPSTIFNMSSLQTLALETNNLSGPIPTNESFRLPQLLFISLSQNHYTGEIPSGFAHCPHLQTLSLSLNQFTGVVPAYLSSLTELNILTLGGNNLTGTIPVSLSNLTQLTVLDLSYNNLHGGVPGELGQLLQLQYMNLAVNNLTGAIPNSLGNASMLDQLELYRNSFSGSVPKTLGNLAALRILDIWQNQLGGELDFLDSLSNCRNLEKLEFANNEFHGFLPDSVGNLSTRLEKLIAYSNHISGKVPAALGNLSGLISVGLFDNEFGGTIPVEITRLETLQALDLSYNRLDGPIPYEIGRLRNLVDLELDNNILSGTIPDSIANISGLLYLILSANTLASVMPRNLWSLKDLMHLDLSHNSLEGFLPTEVGNLRAIIQMDFSANNLSGSIPSTLGDCQTLTYLNLSYNSFQGIIPQSFGRLISINSLDLSSNALSGAIPKSLADLPYLVNLSLSFNRLEGQIPNGSAFANLTAQSFMGNAALCGAPRLGFSPCPTNDAASDSNSKFRLLKYILPPVASMVVLAACFYYQLIYRRRRTKIPVPPNKLYANDNRESISYHELVRATNNFSEANLLGMGSFGSVFRGRLDDGSLTAVKVLNLKNEGASKSFDVECRTLSMVRHRNLVKIISTCSNLEFKALVLQYMPNGSLERWLYSHNYCLSLLQRIEIALDVAFALEYLHHHHFGILVHCDLKPSNVLLDEDMTAHLADFGIAKLLVSDSIFTASTCALGTIGYMAPEYGLTGKVSRRGDVYSYGILLLEIFTRRKPTDTMFAGKSSLRQWVNEAFPNAVLEVVDSNLLKDEASTDTKGCTGGEGLMENQSAMHQCLSSVLKLGLLCSRDSPKERIQMKDVVVILNKIKTESLSKFAKCLNPISKT